MKIDKSTLDKMTILINDLANKYGGMEACIDMYETGKFPRSDRTQDLSMRFRWDLFYASKCYEQCDLLRSPEVGRNHIDTALRKIVPKITKRY